jgi:hypothetical protein
MRLDQNTAVGIYLSGSEVVAEHNQVVDTGGSSASTYEGHALGIHVDIFSVDATVSNNTVSNLTATGSGSEYGIFVNGFESTVRDNVVNDRDRPTRSGTTSVGISQTNGIVLNNAVTNFYTGIATIGIYAHNTVTDCPTPYDSGGHAGAGNSP